MTHFPYVLADPHRPAILPYTTVDPHSQVISPYDPQALKIWFQIRRDQRSSPADPQPTLSSKHPEPASQSSKSSAGQVQQILQTCDWGRYLPRARGHGCVRIGARTATSTSLHRARFCRDQRPVHADLRIQPAYSNALNLRSTSADQAPTQLTQIPWGAWVRRRFAMRRRRRQGSRHVMVRPVARIPGESGPDRIRQNPAGAAPDPQDERRITQARPGVTLAPGFAVSTSLPYHVFLEASR